jgi:hypothetical protein
MTGVEKIVSAHVCRPVERIRRRDLWGWPDA